MTTSAQAAASASMAAETANRALAAVGTSTPSRNAELASIVDTKALEKHIVFDCKDTNFMEWEMVFTSVAGLWGLEDVMNVAVSEATESSVFWRRSAMRR